jgi:hypothetical protein
MKKLNRQGAKVAKGREEDLSRKKTKEKRKGYENEAGVSEDGISAGLIERQRRKVAKKRDFRGWSTDFSRLGCLHESKPPTEVGTPSARNS